MREKLADIRSRDEAGRELEIGPKILQHLATQPWQATLSSAKFDWTGLGPHWHTEPRFAHTAAYGDLDEGQQGKGKHDWPLMITAEWDGITGLTEPYGDDKLEHETQLLRGSPLKITSLVLQPELDPNGDVYRRLPGGITNSVELLHNPLYERHGIHPGGPMMLTAAATAAPDTLIHQASEIRQLHRGIGFRKADLPPELVQRIDNAIAGDADPDFVKDLLAHLDRGGHGMGGFWTHGKDGPALAEGYAKQLKPRVPADYSVVVTANWDGYNSHPDWDTDPDYRKLLPGTDLHIGNVRIMSPTSGGWVDLGGEDESILRFASATQDWLAENPLLSRPQNPYADKSSAGTLRKHRYPDEVDFPLYHGTSAQLQPGDLVSAGHPGNFVRRMKHVYVSDAPERSHQYGGTVYEVTPTGPIGHRRDARPEQGYYASEWPMKVVRLVPTEEYADRLGRLP